MAFFINIGYKFSCPASVTPDGSIILCSAMPMHQLERRRIDSRYPHMSQRMFDPQLYMAGLDATECPKHCAKLASYPWFVVGGLPQYDSAAQNQKQWQAAAEASIPRRWPRTSPTDPAIIAEAVRECLQFQKRMGCFCAVVPSPLTTDPATEYAEELCWLDAAIEFVSGSEDFDLPLYATVALSDICVRYTDPLTNNFLSLAADTVSAREVEGVYLVLEQGAEPPDTRQCGNTRALRSVLHLVHLLAHDAKLNVAVTFLGAFGLACEAAGASIWCDEWYKSLHRLRLADKLLGGRAHPTYWSYPSAIDVNLDDEFDAIVRQRFLDRFRDDTSAAAGLLRAAEAGQPVRRVPPWQYRQSNVSAAIEHYLLSSIQAEAQHRRSKGTARMNFVQNWLESAAAIALDIETQLGPTRKTKTRHVPAWDEAFRLYRADHNV